MKSFNYEGYQTDSGRSMGSWRHIEQIAGIERLKLFKLIDDGEEFRRGAQRKHNIRHGFIQRCYLRSADIVYFQYERRSSLQIESHLLLGNKNPNNFNVIAMGILDAQSQVLSASAVRA